MARKKTKNSSGTGILIIFALAIGAVASIPKNAWIAIGVIACAGALLWLLGSRAKRNRDQATATTTETIRLRQTRGADLTFSLREVSTNMDTDEVSDFYTVQLGSPLKIL